MAIRTVSFEKEEYYHVYNRGNSKQKIFHDRKDYNRLVGLLHACNQKGSFRSEYLQKNEGPLQVKIINPIVAIGAYCLMPNHFHIIITQIESGGISKFMQKLTTAYVMYYNKKYKRTGGLFEGKFKAKHCGTDTYLKYLFSYIHLNPIKLIDPGWQDFGVKNKKEALAYLTNYPYSSFLDYAGNERAQNKIINQPLFPEYFPDKETFLQEIFDWIEFRELQ